MLDHLGEGDRVGRIGKGHASHANMREDGDHHREEVHRSGHQVLHGDVGRQAHGASIRRDDRLDGELDTVEVSLAARLENHIAVGQCLDTHIHHEKLRVTNIQRSGLTIEKCDLGSLHHIGSGVSLGSLHEKEDLDIREECQPHADAAAGGAEVVAKSGVGHVEGVLGDGYIQIRGERSGWSDPSHHVAEVGVVDVASGLVIARGDHRLELCGVSVGLDIHVEIDADALIKVFGDRDQPDLQSDFLIE